MYDLNNIERLKQDIKAKLCRSLDTPIDFDYLSIQLKEQLHEYISPTTLKRFFNYIPSDVTPRLSTLSLLARYVGSIGWKEYCNTPPPIDKKRTETEETLSRNDDFTDIKKLKESDSSEHCIYSAIYQGKKVILKGLKEEFAGIPKYEDKLKKEFDLSFLLVHQNIAAILGFIKIDKIGNCIIEESCGPDNILEYIQKRRATPDTIAPLILQLCETVDYIHAKGISHNKLNVNNILITDNNTIKVIDFSESSKCTASKDDEQTDIKAIAKIISTIQPFMSVKFKRAVKISGKENEQEKYLSAEMLYKDLNKTGTLPITAIFIICILFTAILSSVLSFNLGKNSKNDYVYIDSLKFEQDKLTDMSSSIVIYDTLSKMVIKECNRKCSNALKELDTIPDKKKKIIHIASKYKKMLREKENYSSIVLNRYLPEQCPEYNLYKTSLVKITEDIYLNFFNNTLDSLKQIKE